MPPLATSKHFKSNYTKRDTNLNKASMPINSREYIMSNGKIQVSKTSANLDPKTSFDHPNVLSG